MLFLSAPSFASTWIWAISEYSKILPSSLKNYCQVCHLRASDGPMNNFGMDFAMHGFDVESVAGLDSDDTDTRTARSRGRARKKYQFFTRVFSSKGTGRRIIFLRRKNDVKEMLVDPICGMELNEDTARYKTEHKGKIYCFCSPRCKAEFKKNLRKGTKEPPKKRPKPRKSPRKSCH